MGIVNNLPGSMRLRLGDAMDLRLWIGYQPPCLRQALWLPGGRPPRRSQSPFAGDDGWRLLIRFRSLL